MRSATVSCRVPCRVPAVVQALVPCRVPAVVQALVPAFVLALGLAIAGPARADGLQLPDPGPDAAILQACIADRDLPVAQRIACGTEIFGPCRDAANAADPDAHWRVVFRHCLRREAAAWDRVLNDAYEALVPKAEGAGLAARLRTAQRHWIAFRDAACGWNDEVLFGNEAELKAPACLRNRTALRAIELWDEIAYFP